MDFKQASDLLTGAPAYTLPRLAAVFGRTLGLMNRWRSANPEQARRPPAEWPAILAAQAVAHAGELEEHAARLRALARELAP